MSIRDLPEAKRKEYYRGAKRKQREQKKLETERAEQEAPTLAQRLRKANPSAKESDEELVDNA